MSRDVNSEEIGTHTRVRECAMVNYANKIFRPKEPYGNWISIMLCVTSISIDPLFFYIPVIHYDCFNLDKNLGIIAFILRSAVDLIYMICVLIPWETPDHNSALCRQTDHVGNSALCCRLSCQYPAVGKACYIDLLAVLPLPQVVIITVFGGATMNYYKAMRVLKYFVFFQFVPRVIRIYPLLKKAKGTLGIPWAKAAFNLYLYLISGHVFGALWYFNAIDTALHCWNGKNHDYDIKCLPPDMKQNCSTKPELSELAYDFGIYKTVLEHNVTQGGFAQRYIYCFRWGMQSLSCFAENLETSADTWENSFTLTISIASLVLFVFLIGNMQQYLQSGTLRSEEKKQMMRETEKWKLFSNLPKNLQRQVKKHLLHVWRETKGVDLENFLNNLPEDLRSKIKSALRLKLLLKTVPNFISVSEQRLNAMCERLKYVLYSDEVYIVRKNDEVHKMLFIIHGKLLIDDNSNDNHENFVGYQSNFCGDELSTWAQDLPSSPNLPISKKNIKTATGGVEAFALTADDLKDVFTRFK